MPLFAMVSPAAGVRKILGNGLRSLFCVVLLAASPAHAAVTTTTLTITANGGAVTTVATGTVVTLTAAVTTGSTALTTGQVNFCDASATYCTDVHLLGTAQLTSAGTATLRFVPGIGSHSYKTVFVGTNSYLSSSSTVSALTVTGPGTGSYPTTTSITLPYAQVGNYTLTATVAGSGAAPSPSPTGSVSFLDTSNGNSILAMATLTRNLSFTTSWNTTTGQKPTATAGDFNGDGKLDLAVTNGNEVTVLLGNGDGTFTVTTGPATGNVPSSIAKGDFNGDGKADLAITNSADNTVTILLGNGDGTFTVTTSPATGNAPSSITVGDFNGDGKADLAITNSTDNTVTMLLGNGDGTFTAATSLATGNAPSSIAVGDFNGDGKADLAIANSTDNTVTMLLGNGDGTFTSTTSLATGSSPVALVVGDFNGDGKADLAVAQTLLNSSGGVLVLLGNGDGTFTASNVQFSQGTSSSIAVGDFNGDGKPDLAVGTSSGFSVAVLLGQGDGTFDTSASRTAGGIAYSLAVGDFSGDGNTDIALFGSYSGLVLLTQPAQAAVATVTGISPVGEGTHQIIASYPGDVTYSPSVSTAIGLTASPGTTLTLSADPINSSDSGQTVTLTATLTPFSVPQRTTNGESIMFYDGTGSIGSGNLQSGVATLSTTSLRAGPHTFKSVYVSDGDLGSSISNALSYTVNSTSLPAISFSVANHIYGISPFSVGATSNSTGELTYSVLSGPATISGSTVTVTGVGTVVLQVSQAATGTYAVGTQAASFVVNPASLTISANNAARVFGAPNPAFTGTVTGAVNGDTFTETFSTSATAASITGSYPVVPSVTGAHIGNYTVTATGGTLTVSQAGTATTLALSNQNMTLTANVASLTSGTPTGSVGFYEGQTLVGTGTLSNGVATYTTSSSPSGNVFVTAKYSGDANFTQSGSPPIFLLSVALANSSLTVASAGSIVDTVSLSSAPGYTGTVQFSCANLPQAATCSFQPSSFSFTGATNTGSVSLTIQTGVATQAALSPVRSTTEGVQSTFLATLIWVPGLFATIFTRGRRRLGPRTRKSLLLVLLLCSMAATLTSCGGSSSTGSSSSSGKTPAGTYPVQLIVSGSNGLSQTANLNLIIQ